MNKTASTVVRSIDADGAAAAATSHKRLGKLVRGTGNTALMKIVLPLCVAALFSATSFHVGVSSGNQSDSGMFFMPSNSTSIAEAEEQNNASYTENIEHTDSTKSLPSTTTHGDEKGCIISAALVIFGVPKSFQYIYKAYNKHVVQRNPHICFKIHMHMYNDLHQTPFNNKRSSEKGAKLQSPEDIASILNTTGGIPSKLVTSSQLHLDRSELSWMQNDITEHLADLNLQTMMNVFRQGNSMKEAFTSAFFAFELQHNHERNRHGYDVYVFARSDTLLITPIDIPKSGVGDHDLYVPSWHNFGGENDRFAVAGPTAANVWVAAKLDVFKEMVLNPALTLNLFEKKGSQERPYGWVGKLANPEKMLRFWLEANDELNVTRGDNQWANLIRVRSRGMLHQPDVRLFKMNKRNIKDVII